MRPRLSSNPRTAPLPEAALRAWGPPRRIAPLTTSKDSPAFKRLISLGLGVISLWMLWCALGPALHALFPGPAEVLAHDRALATHPPVPARVLPVYRIGDSFSVALPDGRMLGATERGGVTHFSDLPPNPQPGDHYTVTEGGEAQGISWIWATPLGWSHPAWIDP